MLPIPSLLKRALELHRAGSFAEAERGYRSLLRAAPRHFDATHLLGVLQFQRGRFDEACRLLETAIAIDPDSADAHAHLGSALHAQGRFESALASFDAALRRRPSSAAIFSNRGITLHAMGRHAEALASYDAALQLDPDLAEALCNRSVPLWKLRRYDEALASCERALALKPEVANGWSNRGAILNFLRRHDKALTSCDTALAASANDAAAHFNRGIALHGLRRQAEALESYDRAIALDPRLAEPLNARALSLLSLGRYEEAAGDFECAVALDPGLDFALGNLLLAKMRGCDWQDHAELSDRLTAAIRAGKTAAVPFATVTLLDCASDQLACSKAWVGATCPPSPTPLWIGERYPHNRIRIAYLSADFHDHATAYLAAELFERHDRQRFEVFGISFGPDDRGEMRSRLGAAFDRFIDVRAGDDLGAARLLREHEIDIAVDLKGYTEGSRPGILAWRPAPVQVNYLGYPGTLGAPYIDYILADRFVLPPEAAANYTEHVVRLPDCYQVNDSRRRIAAYVPSRAEAGLPAAGFVFCCFNNSYKITPAFFDLWMRLLRRIDGAVLWLLRANAAAERNLRREAQRRGVDPGRLVFAPRAPLAEHLARHRLADLFIDTLPCNAHTTASDALWSGLPVLTCVGNTFAGRVAGSLLHALGLPQLAAATLEEYETKAIALATDARRLRALTEKLAQQRSQSPLFDCERFRRHIEAAYVTMWERYQRGDPPAGFSVAPLS